MRNGHGVRWLCPVHNGESPPEHPDGVGLITAPSDVAPFAAITGCSYDGTTDTALTYEIRRQLPDVVHLLAFGGFSSPLGVWIADRMGAPTVISVDTRELLCHRGTLVNERGEACEDWGAPSRCLECCTAPFEGGLSPARARMARGLRWLGPWSPYPKEYEFQNRLDQFVGGLAWATAITVRDEEERARLVAAGAPPRNIRVVEDAADATAMAEVYTSAGEAWAGIAEA